MKGRIHSVETFGAVDGPGTRYVVFMQGCPLRCIYCCNPDTWDAKGGKTISVRQLVKEIEKYKNYIMEGGVTFTGGEPLLQSKFVLQATKKLKKLGLHVAIDTSGVIPLQETKKVIDACDLVLLDIKALDSALHQTLTGLPNERTLQTLSYCETIKKPVWIRHVIVPTYTLDVEKLEELAKYLTQFTCIKNIELLALHHMGQFKWEELGVPYTLKDVKTPTKEEMDKVKAIFTKYKLPVRQQ